MESGWSTDFSFAYFRGVIGAIQTNFECRLLSQAPKALQQPPPKPVLFLRHDLCLDPTGALTMAQMEHEFGIQATYMVMTNSPLYEFEDDSAIFTLRQMIGMGHEIGLHFDFDSEEEREENPEMGFQVVSKVRSACELLETLIEQRVPSISFHRPLAQFLRGPLAVDDKVNAYSRELMSWYLSDSAGNWREGEPLPLLSNPDRPLLQLLIHPFWWGEEHMSAGDRLQTYFDAVTRGCSVQQVRALDIALTSHLPGVRRTGLANPTYQDR